LSEVGVGGEEEEGGGKERRKEEGRKWSSGRSGAARGCRGKAAYQPLWARLDETDRHEGSQRACGGCSLDNGLNTFKWMALQTRPGPAHGLDRRASARLATVHGCLSPQRDGQRGARVWAESVARCRLRQAGSRRRTGSGRRAQSAGCGAGLVGAQKKAHERRPRRRAVYRWRWGRGWAR
jgi:hypothetical protein